MKNTEQEIGNQFLSLINNQREDVVNALIRADIDVDTNITSTKLFSLVKSLVMRYQDLDDIKSKNAILNISKLIVSNQSSFSSFYNATNSGGRPNNPITMNVNSSDDEPKRDRFGNVLSKENLDKAVKVGNVLLDWWNSRKDKNSEPDNTNSGGSSNNNNNNPNNGNNNNNRPSSGMSTTKIIALSFVGVLLIGGVIVAVKMSR